jgi:3,4-dihydroxy 2-butanone 4-phosphate synthase/GTP cyclohydrolase II
MDTVERALDALRRGEPVIVADGAERENEADLILAAEHATAERIRFMVRHTSGLICVALPGQRLDELDLLLMVPSNSESYGTAFTVSVDCLHGTTSGISAGDRATTIRALVDPTRRPEDFARPGHVFPLRARPGGVLQRPGHTEAAVDLTRLAGLTPAGVLCELVNPDGTMTRGAALLRFAEEHQLVTITIEQVIAFRRRHEKVVLLHRHCLTGQGPGADTCDCHLQLDLAMARIADDGRGVIVPLRTEPAGSAPLVALG